MTDHINVVLVLQSCSDPLHIVPGVSSDTHATSGGVCKFRIREFEGDVDVIEEIFVAIHDEMDRSIKQEEIAGDIPSPEIKSEPDDVSYVCICLL